VLAVKYGVQASEYMRVHGATVSIAAVAVLAAGFGAFLWWSRRRLKPIECK